MTFKKTNHKEICLKEFEKKYNQRLFNFILQKVKKQEDAEEIYQDTLLSVYYSFPSFNKKSSFFTWVCAISKHEIADFYRKRKIKTILFSAFPFLETIASKALSPETAYEEKELKRRLLLVFKNLCEGYCQILRLKYIDDLSIKEIAKKLGKTEKAIEMKLRRARHAFLKLYKDEKNFKKTGFNINSRDLFIIAQHLGIAVSSLQDFKSNQD